MQKYDVIHYIREAYLKGDNPTQYARVDRSYLGKLPKGKTRGPAPAAIEPWVAMDYGPSLMATVEAGDDGSNIAYKGIAVRLDPGPGGVSRGRAWSLFEHDTLRLAGRMDRRGVHRLGRNQLQRQAPGTPTVVGSSGLRIRPAPAGRTRRPAASMTLDPRGRDGRPYGPLPRRWAHYRGFITMASG